jgi:hypothetical protein
MIGMDEKKITAVVEKVLGLRRITRESGMSTRRSQNSLLATLSDDELGTAALLLEKWAAA